jgi:hypothetical protein
VGEVVFITFVMPNSLEKKWKLVGKNWTGVEKKLACCGKNWP